MEFCCQNTFLSKTKQFKNSVHNLIMIQANVHVHKCYVTRPITEYRYLSIISKNREKKYSFVIKDRIQLVTCKS